MPKINVIDRNKSSNVVDRLFTEEDIIQPIQSESEVSESSMMVYEVPLKYIKPRPVNKYMVSDIEELAGSIERTGQWQPIIVRMNPNKQEKEKFVIVGGERRYSAMRLLHERYKKEGNEAKAKIYSSIKAHILSEEDEKNEEAIYADTNDYSRQLTNFERIIRLDPSQIRFETKDEQEEFVKEVYGEEAIERYRNGQLNIKFNQGDLSKYIRSKLLKKEPNLDISDKTIRRYLKFIEDADDTLIAATLKGTIPIREATLLGKLSKEDQAFATMVVGTEEYSELLQEVSSKKKAVVSEEEEERTPESIYASNIKTLFRVKSQFEKIQEDISDRQMNGNEKEFLRQVRTIIKAIERLQEMPQK